MKFYNIYSLLFLGFLISMFANPMQAQKLSPKFSGWVVDNQGQPLIGATVSWRDSSSIGTVANEEGWFELNRIDTLHPYILNIRHVGFAPVEVEILPVENHLKLEVGSDAKLEQVEIVSTKRDAFASTLNTNNVETLGAGELRRAACCSLAESFENNATVNVSFADAVTGARDIEMLGLKGTYSQMMIENRPAFNRLGRAYGLEYIPGTFVDNIQISKGASTVRNGVQGITGQINTELIKPNHAPPLFVNLYASHFGRVELNTNLNFKLKNDWATGLLLHGNYNAAQLDHNHDMFLDVPHKQQLNGLWRMMKHGKKIHAEFNVQGIIDNRFGGQTAALFEKMNHPLPARLYQLSSDTRRVEAFGKLGYLGFNNPYQSVAFIYSGTIHEQKSLFGDRRYDALQRSLYGNLIYQTNLFGIKDHQLNSGITYNLDDFKELFSDINLDRTEHQVGLFTEYSYIKQLDAIKGREFGLVLGMRGDWINTPQYSKIYASPRANIKYNFNENLVIRASGGQGMRVPNVLMENFRYMASARRFILQENILPEVAWNYGLNLTHNYKLGEREGSLSIDAYRTDFTNQLISDIDAASDEVRFYNLDGKSYANSFLISWTQDIVQGFELRLAYKLNDVRSTYNDTLRLQPFSPMHRGLMSLHYTTPNKAWEFNFNTQLVGNQRLPFIAGNTSDLPAYRQNAEAPAYVLLNAQITKNFKNGFEIYVGGENIGNYRQQAPILAADDPFGLQTGSRPFDATAVYAPVMGVMGYMGLRYTLPSKKDRLENPKFIAQGEEIKILTSAQCGMCTSTIEAALKPMPGVLSVSLNLANKVLTVRYDDKKTNPDAIRKAIAEVGYDADGVTSNPKAYEALPACCKKDGGH